MTIESGSAFVPNCVLRDPRLSAQARLLYSILKSYAWQDGDAFPGQVRLAKEMGCSDRMVRIYLRELEDSGLVNVEQRGKTITNKYYLTDQINSEWNPTSASDRKPTSTHIESEWKPVSSVTGNPLPLVTGNTLPTNKTQGNKTQGNKTQSPPNPLMVAEDEKAKMRKELRKLFPPNQQMSISGATNERLHEITDNYPLDWVKRAFEITADKGKDLVYLRAILDHWQNHSFECVCQNPKAPVPTPLPFRQAFYEKPVPFEQAKKPFREEDYKVSQADLDANRRRYEANLAWEEANRIAGVAYKLRQQQEQQGQVQLQA